MNMPSAGYPPIAPTTVADAAPKKTPPTGGPPPAARKAGATGSAPISLGIIDQANPTVSQLLYNHPDFRDQCWSLIFAKLNRDKPYTKILPGSEIFLHPQTGELTWTPPGQATPNPPIPASRSPQTADQPQTAPLSEATGQPVTVGVLDNNTTTVSDLLLRHPQYGAETWHILTAPANADKNFTAIRPGTPITLDPATLELSWQSPPAPQDTVMAQRPSLPQGTGIISLGKISPETPTVSQLLQKNPDYGQATWDIILNDQNRNKAFAAIRPETEIFLDRATLELSWRNGLASREKTLFSEAAKIRPAVKIQQDREFSSQLAQAVKPYYGRSHDDINCYGLVVRGLRRIGVRYLGHGGLRDRLIQMAVQQGLPPNAYFNGEGLIAAAGHKVYDKTIYRVKDPVAEANKIISELTPQLEKGHILSFSTPTRGHTGIISQTGNTWTFINSGEMDNQLGHAERKQKVGEEVLVEEIKNWCRIAAANKQSLTITVGRLQKEKLATAMRDSNQPIISSVL